MTWKGVRRKKRESPNCFANKLSPVLTNNFMIINFSAFDNPFSHDLSCPSCGARGQMLDYSSYSRFCLSPSDRTKRLRVRVVFCPSCGSYHTILPYDARPFSSFSYPFIFEVLFQYCCGPWAGNKSRTAALFDISRTTLRRWIDRYSSLLFLSCILIRDLDRSPYDLLAHIRSSMHAFLKSFLRFHECAYFSPHTILSAPFVYGLFSPS